MDDKTFEQFERRMDERHDALNRLLAEQFAGLHTALESRPCSKHEDDIGVLFGWQRRRDELTAYWKGVAASTMKISGIVGSAAAVVLGLLKTGIGHRILASLLGDYATK